MVKVASGFGLGSFTSLGDATYAQLNKPASHSPKALKRGAFIKGRGSAKDSGRPLAWVSATCTHAHIEIVVRWWPVVGPCRARNALRFLA